ncbi:hypothetical protein QJS10_CPB22g00208 [Acorus calamus]|uniref:RING-CH-type domain-containing protein n=1 Tax=Acorus calamus TaxID=4465 RepID=A0AAV9C2J1_ACOCL|nr:hypothetical protein QJS10_CPB22g00208 [Acorus calamus]
MEREGTEWRQLSMVLDRQMPLEGNKRTEDASSTTSTPQPRKPNLSSLQIPDKLLENPLPTSTRITIPSAPTPSSTRAGLPPRPGSTKSKPSIRNMLPQRSFKANTVTSEEKTVLLNQQASSSEVAEDKPSASRTFSLTRAFSSLSAKRTYSLPSTPIGSSVPEPVQVSEKTVDIQEVQHHMARSLSVPMNAKGRGLKRTDSLGGLLRVIPVTPRPAAADCTTLNDGITAENVTEDDGEDILEEEAVCRICFVELSEGGETLKMECSCKGELALAHQECAIKWFSIKGNKTCDICKQDVKNLPVTLLRIQNAQNANRRVANTPQQREAARFRVCQDVPVLVMVSMLAYFFFLEQLLVTDLGQHSLAVSLPFSCVLGLLSSMISATMVPKNYIWTYAFFQFAIVILFAHIFYNVLNVPAVLSVLLSSFTGFGIAISSNSLLVEFLRWRSRRNLQSARRQNNRAAQQQESVENLESGAGDGARNVSTNG